MFGRHYALDKHHLLQNKKPDDLLTELIKRAQKTVLDLYVPYLISIQWVIESQNSDRETEKQSRFRSGRAYLYCNI